MMQLDVDTAWQGGVTGDLSRQIVTCHDGMAVRLPKFIGLMPLRLSSSASAADELPSSGGGDAPVARVSRRL